ncbi:MAG TPA: hypothetical protein PKL84_13655, partial [Candidatus Hydrogenedentes bacterium]|nr:hypothetical protein [Candidatus Hydrogenedentota bacterium]
ARRSWVSSSAVNAQRLVQAFRHQEDMRVHLIRVPAIIGKEMFESERRRLDMTREVLQNFCKSDPGYRYLYGDKPIFPTTAQAEAYLSERWLRRGTDPGQFGTILEQDFLLTGLSSLDKTAGFVHLSDLALDKQVEYFRERFHASGDVASHIFTEDSKIPRLDHPAHPEIGAENARVLSLWPEDLTQCADLHRATPGGVIVLSCGQKKAHALLIALTGLQIANYVVIDTNLAWKLYEHMGMINEQERDFSTVELWDFSVNGSNGQENG